MWRLAEAARVAALADRSVAARVAVHLVEEREMLPGSVERQRVRGLHFRVTDALTAMCRAAELRHEAKDGAFVPPFTMVQVHAGQTYAALVERHGAAGVRLASAEALGGSGGGSGVFIDGYVDQGRMIGALQRQIGGDVALSVRRVRPSARGGRVAVTVRRLVDDVCLNGLTLSRVLERHGWAPKGDHREALRLALCGALDRMSWVVCGRAAR
jgi:hypothetical protein